ncbi:MAG: class I SAM-dependent methyltransferase [Candidatus Omnitrophica bacterium]|nr:class I SAM-dependent methyltransferase [Candidatus Omnitrophota bacterium]
MIENKKKENAAFVQQISLDRISDQFNGFKPLRKKEPLRRILSRLISRRMLFFQQTKIKNVLSVPINFPYNFLCLGDRFAQDASLAAMLSLLHKKPDEIKNMLIVGCGSGYGEDVQFWLRQPIKNIYGIDAIRHTLWESKIIPDLIQKYDKNIIFKQTMAEQTPFESNFFDFVTSSAVIEHIKSVDLAITEMHRILRPGGYAWHAFGPLYYSYAGDHCINAYGRQHGYDHLLCGEDTYRRMIEDDQFFKHHAEDPLCNYWAKQQQFSYYKPEEYIRYFQKYFQLVDVVLVISPEGLRYRKLYPEKWNQLKENGLEDIDLLAKGFLTILQKPLN